MEKWICLNSCHMKTGEVAEEEQGETGREYEGWRRPCVWPSVFAHSQTAEQPPILSLTHTHTHTLAHFRLADPLSQGMETSTF